MSELILSSVVIKSTSKNMRQAQHYPITSDMPHYLWDFLTWIKNQGVTDEKLEVSVYTIGGVTMEKFINWLIDNKIDFVEYHTKHNVFEVQEI